MPMPQIMIERISWVIGKTCILPTDLHVPALLISIVKYGIFVFPYTNPLGGQLAPQIVSARGLTLGERERDLSFPWKAPPGKQPMN